jgi:predicted hydrolase (HD superfamily)
MSGALPEMEEVVSLWKKYNDDAYLYKHALAVAAAMRHFAVKFGGDADEWEKIGFVHDIDYQKYPNEHCEKVKEILGENGWPEYAIRAVVSHGYALVNDVEPLSDLEKTLYAVDELTGFITACALVRPSKSVADLEVKSVKKKWKTPAFAAKVDREVVERGAAMLNLSFEELTEEVINAMRSIREELGL